MNHERVRRIEFAALSLAIGLAALCYPPSRALAGVASRPSQPATETSRSAKGRRGLGSAENPIPLAGTETRASLLGPAGPTGSFATRLGSLRVSLVGIPDFVFDAGGAPDLFGDPSWPVESNVFSGGAIGVELAGSGSLHLESGRMILRDPIRVMGRDAPGNEYWVSSAGIEVRF